MSDCPYKFCSAGIGLNVLDGIDVYELYINSLVKVNSERVWIHESHRYVTADSPENVPAPMYLSELYDMYLNGQK